MRSVFVLTWVVLGLCACGRHSNEKSNPNKPDELKWSAVRLTDLPGHPVVAIGEDPSQNVDFVRVQTGESALTYRVDGTGRTPIMSEVALNLNLRSLSPVDVTSNARNVQSYILAKNYSLVSRCRESRFWPSVAGVDMREMGPLLLSLQALNSLNRPWRYAIAIDQSTFQVVGVSGLSIAQAIKAPAYESATVTEGYMFGVKSDSTMMPLRFAANCQQVYDDFVFQGSEHTFLANKILPQYENELSRRFDLNSKVANDDPLKREQIHVSSDLDKDHLNLIINGPSKNEIENLILIAVKKNGERS